MLPRPVERTLKVHAQVDGWRTSAPACAIECCDFIIQSLLRAACIFLVAARLA
jgi:hypothetical protein